MSLLDPFPKVHLRDSLSTKPTEPVTGVYLDPAGPSHWHLAPGHATSFQPLSSSSLAAWCYRGPGQQGPAYPGQ